jgi:hypothetical protein
MRNFKTILGAVVVAFLMVSCSDEKTPEQQPQPLATKTVKNFAAPAGGGGGNYTGDFAKFSFKTGAKTTGDDWDIAFRATQIIVNGGAKIESINEEPNRTGNAAIAIVSNTLKDLKDAPADSEFKQDAKGAFGLTTGSGKGWYLYDPSNHTIKPAAGKILVVKTHDGRFAKVEIESYYKDKNASNPANGRYFTFSYVYNPTAGQKSFQ